MRAEAERPLLGKQVGAVDAKGANGDVLEQEVGVFDGQRYVLLAAHSYLRGQVPLLIVVLNDHQGFIESNSFISGDDRLHNNMVTSIPYLISLYLEVKSTLARSK